MSKLTVRLLPVITLVILLVIITGCFSDDIEGDGINNTGDWESNPPPATSKIANHSAARLPVLESIPDSAISNVKSNLVIAYGHTSHGSQIVDGLSRLDSFMTGRGAVSGKYSGYTLRDCPFSGASDLGNPNYTAWETATRNYLGAPDSATGRGQTHPEVNVIAWSWCGQADTTEANIATYLTLMDGLEKDYHKVKFIYMTGHLNGGGLSGNLHLRNEQIRTYCRTNGKWLFDFADIETYGPDGTYYGDRHPTDGCNYDYNGSGSTTQEGDPATPTGGDRNWAIDWRNSHKQGVDWYNCGSAHSDPLNANMKGYAFWWLMARLAGWGG